WRAAAPRWPGPCDAPWSGRTSDRGPLSGISRAAGSAILGEAVRAAIQERYPQADVLVHTDPV
ncbi:MAG: hypothetical protein ACK4VV_12360, partial [Pseudomonas sp.]